MRGVAQVAELRRAHRLCGGAVEIDMPESSVRVEGADRDDPAVLIEEEDQFASPARQVGHAPCGLWGGGGVGWRLGGGEGRRPGRRPSAAALLRVRVCGAATEAGTPTSTSTPPTPPSTLPSLPAAAGC